MTTTKDIIAIIQRNSMMQLRQNIQENAPLAEQGFDSLDRVMLLHEVEENFRVKISPESASKLHTLSDIVDFLNSGK